MDDWGNGMVSFLIGGGMDGRGMTCLAVSGIWYAYRGEDLGCMSKWFLVRLFIVHWWMCV